MTNLQELTSKVTSYIESYNFRHTELIKKRQGPKIEVVIKLENSNFY